MFPAIAVVVVAVVLFGGFVFACEASKEQDEAIREGYRRADNLREMAKRNGWPLHMESYREGMEGYVHHADDDMEYLITLG